MARTAALPALKAEIRSFTLSRRDPTVPDAGTAGRIHAGAQLA